MFLQSSVFPPNGPVPQRHTGEGEDISPPLAWGDLPVGTGELALICDDPDAPTPEPWVHWLLYKIPPTVTELPEGVHAGPRVESPAPMMQGCNSWLTGRTIGYRGPMPPPGHGVHHYRFRLYALDAPLEVKPLLDNAALQESLRGHLLAEAELIGTYER